MDGIRFYLEFPTMRAKRTSGKGNIGHSGNVFAAYVCNGRTDSLAYEGLGALYGNPNAPVVHARAAGEWLRQHCKRIPEKLAREIHPRLFARLDKDSKRG